MNCANNFCFHVYLMLHACAARFDVTENLENFCELNKALNYSVPPCVVHGASETDRSKDACCPRSLVGVGVGGCFLGPSDPCQMLVCQRNLAFVWFRSKIWRAVQILAAANYNICLVPGDFFYYSSHRIFDTYMKY